MPGLEAWAREKAILPFCGRESSASAVFVASTRVCLTAHEGSHIISEAMITIAR
jgi:hypothetical protein